MIIQYAVAIPQKESLSENEQHSIITNNKHIFRMFTKPDRYNNDPKNSHHWTTNYVYNTVIPLLSNDLQLDINVNQYTYIENNTSIGDYSYHMHRTPMKLRFHNYDDNTILSGTQSILRMTKQEKAWSDYHRLYRGSHSISSVYNYNNTSNRSLVIVGDSMTVPIIPILINHVKKIICLDARSGKYIPNLIEWAEITDILFIFTTLNWTHGKLWKQYLYPYMKHK